jgi:hypothetical protein
MAVLDEATGSSCVVGMDVDELVVDGAVDWMCVEDVVIALVLVSYSK